MLHHLRRPPRHAGQLLMTPFLYLDKVLQSYGLRLNYGSLYRQPQWVKWRNEELVVSLHGSPSETLTTLCLLTRTEADVWNLTGLPENPNLESLAIWLDDNQSTLEDFTLHLEALTA